MFTYVMATRGNDRVKIGRTTNPTARQASLQTAQPETLTTLVLLDGDREQELHQQFARYRIRGEWFDYGYHVRKFVAQHTGQPLRMTFYVWLMGQLARRDDVGRLACLVQADKKYPKDFNQLHLLFAYFGQQAKTLKQIVKQAHTEWRLECTTDTNGKRYAKGLVK